MAIHLLILSLIIDGVQRFALKETGREKNVNPFHLIKNVILLTLTSNAIYTNLFIKNFKQNLVKWHGFVSLMIFSSFESVIRNLDHFNNFTQN